MAMALAVPGRHGAPVSSHLIAGGAGGGGGGLPPGETVISWTLSACICFAGIFFLLLLLLLHVLIRLFLVHGGFNVDGAGGCFVPQVEHW